MQNNKQEGNVSLMEQSQSRIKKWYPLVCLLSLLMFFLTIYLFQFKSLFKDGLLYKIANSNYLTYFVSLVVLILSFLLFRYLFSLIPEKRMAIILDKELSRPARITIFCALYFTIVASFILYIVITERSEEVFGANLNALAWYKLPSALVIPILLLILFFGIRHFYIGGNLSKTLVYLSYGVAIILSYFLTLFYHQSEELHIYHVAAYTESITNVLSGVPYNIYTTGIYGHYALILALLTKIFGSSALALITIMAVLGAISTAFCAYILHNVVSNNTLRILGIFASIVTLSVFRLNSYYQLQPHRIVFTLGLIAYLVWMVKKNKFSILWFIVGFGICSLSIIWNTECGVFSVVAFVIAIITYFWQKEKWYSKRMLIIYGLLLCASIVTILLPILIVNIYNSFCGGEWIFKDFFFPIFTESYMTGSLAEPLPRGFQVWYWALALFVLMIFYALYHTLFIRKNENKFNNLAPIFMAIGVISLLNLSYYMNRPAYLNMDICIALASVSLAVFAERFCSSFSNIYKKGANILGIASGVLSLLCVTILITIASLNLAMGDTLVSRAELGHWNRRQFLEDSRQFNEIIIDDSIVIGNGANLYLLQNKKQSVEHYRDFSDLMVGGSFVKEKIISDIFEHGRVSIYMTSEHAIDIDKAVVDSGEFVLVSFGEVNGYMLNCYEKAN